MTTPREADPTRSRSGRRRARPRRQARREHIAADLEVPCGGVGQRDGDNCRCAGEGHDHVGEVLFHHQAQIHHQILVLHHQAHRHHQTRHHRGFLAHYGGLLAHYGGLLADHDSGPDDDHYPGSETDPDHDDP